MTSPKKQRIDIGRIGENIVANELLADGFLVTHLDKGTRGVSANADLLVGREDTKNPVLIQVKATRSDSLDFIFLGGVSLDIIEKRTPIFDSKPGFKAKFIAAVSYKSNKQYRVFIIPVKVAERNALKIIRQWHLHPKMDGSQRAAIPTAYFDISDRPAKDGQKMRSESRRMARQAFLKYEWPRKRSPQLAFLK
jgi:hypothetical protein